MAIFEEKQPRLWICILLLLAAFACSYPLWHVQDRELFWAEGTYAAAVTELTSFPPVMQAHGVYQPRIYPLFPLFTKALVDCGLSAEAALRSVSVFSLLALTALVFLACYRTSGLQAAAAGAAVMMTTFLTGEKAMEGYPHMLTVLILFGGWLTWFELAMGRGKWNQAWISAGLFSGLAFYCAGFTGLVYFLVPLLTQHRPLNVWTKLRYPGLLIGMLFTSLLIFFWWIPQWSLPASDVSYAWNFTGYLKHILMFPLDAAFRFLPWTLLFWAPFCAALIPLDQNPLFSKFHRILFCTLAVMVWLNPASRGRDILYLAPLAAVMTGSYYWIVVRRYGHCFLKLFRCIGWILLLLAPAALGYLFCPEEILTRFFTFEYELSYRQQMPDLLITVIEITAAALLSVIALRGCRKKYPVWIVYLLLFSSMMLFFWGIVGSYRACDRSRHEVAEQFRKALPPKAAVLYKDASISGLYPECCYMKVRVLTADTTKDFASGEETVYVISAGVPAAQGRNWTRLHDSVYKDTRLYLYEGVLRKDEEEYDIEFE